MNKFNLKNIENFLIGFDLDGTILNSFGKISNKTMEIISELKRKNLLVLCGGRSKEFNLEYYNKLKIESPFVNFSGVTISNLSNEEDIILGSINLKLIKKIFIEKDIIKSSSYIEINTSISNYRIKKNSDLNKIQGEILNVVVFLSNSKKENDDLHRNLVNEYKGEMIIRNLGYKETWFLAGKSYSMPSSLFLISPPETSKEKSLELIRIKNRIEKNKTIFFGDNVNDIEAIKWAKFGIAMNNSLPEVKKVADQVLNKGVDEDGFYYFFKSK